MPTNVINNDSPIIRDNLLKLNFIPFSQGPEYNQVGGLGLPSDIKLEYPLASDSLSTIYDNREYYLSKLSNQNRYRLTEYSEIDIVNTSINTGLGGEYVSPTSLDNSAVGQGVNSFPFNGEKPMNYLTNLNMYASPNENIDVSSEVSSLALSISRYGNYSDENNKRGGVFGISKEVIDVIGSIVTGKNIGY